MMGVHGNGLTSLLWMKPTPRSAVMEFFYPEGFVHDYEWITRTVGITHYAFWGNRCAHIESFASDGRSSDASQLLRKSQQTSW